MRGNCRTIANAVLFLTLAASPAHAISIELKDAASDRIERQRAFVDGRLPLPATPDTSRTEQRIAEKGLKSGAPLLIRIFKEESELELWMESDGGVFALFATYPICHWSGTLGPKLREGDKQTPEGFYTLAARQLRHLGRWPRSLNLGYPNAYDRAHGRNGSYILVHGGCSSVGCIAMTNPVITEVHALARAALNGRQRHIPVHVFPFRMTAAKLAAHADAPWRAFWSDLKEGYDSFERTRLPPRVAVCDGRYRTADGAKAAAPGESASTARDKASRLASDSAIRDACPAPYVAAAQRTAESDQVFPGISMSRLGGPMPAGHSARK